MSRVVRLTCGAKLNLFLRVTGRRPDGFHDLESVFHAIDLVDDMHIETGDDGLIRTEMTWAAGAAGPLIDPRHNIVQRAALSLRERAPGGGGARISLLKRIPVGAGLGGGSSDAAGALAGLSRLWSVPPEALGDLAAELGSDVPFCLRGGSTALVTGRGEHVEPRPGPPRPLWFVLGLSRDPLLTAEVYARHRIRKSAPDRAARMAAAVQAGDPREVAGLLWNDLEGAALLLRPEIERARSRLLEAGALGAAVSGSGPTIFGVAADEAHAGTLASAVAGEFDRVVVARSAPGCVLEA
jgi:4-diphosphocytidyl-2-C-methyl-D-erythritol kinase